MNAEKEIHALVTAWSRALEARDTDAMMANYDENVVLYDAIPPAQTTGRAALKALWDACLPHFPERFRSEHRDLTIEASGDLAVARGWHHFVPEPADHPSGATWMRMTTVFRRTNGAWRVTHEHVSIPFDPMSGAAAYVTEGQLRAAGVL